MITRSRKVTLPTASDYILHAKEANRIARTLLQLDIPEDTRQIEAISGKFSLGLSLQAAELAGKAMLRCLGNSPQEIQKMHKHHNLPTLLDQVQDAAETAFKQGKTKLEPFTNFTCKPIEVNGKTFSTTIGQYLDLHFSKGPSAFPRNYFYPDCHEFIGPIPFETLLHISDALIETAENLAGATTSP